MPTKLRILIIRTSALGDVVHALPVLAALRRHLPGAHVGWLVEEAFAPLLEGHPDLDEILPARLRAWRHRLFEGRAWGEAREFWRRLDGFRPDVVLDLMGSHKAGLLAAATFADRRLGLDRVDRREPSSAIWLSETVPARGRHAVDRMLSVLDALPLPAEPADFAGDKLVGRTADFGGELPRDFVLMHPRTAWANKNYPLEDWAEVARYLVSEEGLDVVVGWGPGEEDAAKTVAEASGRARTLPALASLPELVELSRQARIVIGGDTGPVHLAHALGTPVVCVMGPTDPDVNGPYAMPELAVVHKLPCSFCYKRFESAKPCLLNIRPEHVIEHVLPLLTVN